MTEDAIRGQAAMTFGKVSPFSGCLSCARDTGLGIDDDVGIGCEEAGAHERRHSQKSRSRIATRVGDKTRAARAVRSSSVRP